MVLNTSEYLQTVLKNTAVFNGVSENYSQSNHSGQFQRTEKIDWTNENSKYNYMLLTSEKSAKMKARTGWKRDATFLSQSRRVVDAKTITLDLKQLAEKKLKFSPFCKKFNNPDISGPESS